MKEILSLCKQLVAAYDAYHLARTRAIEEQMVSEILNLIGELEERLREGPGADRLLVKDC